MLSAKQIASGQQGEIEVKIHTNGLRGNLSKSVAILTNDPMQPETALSVTASVEPEFLLSQRWIFFGSLPRGRQVTKEVTITIPGERAVSVLSAESTDESVTVQLEPVPGTDERQFRVLAIRKPDAPIGYHFGVVIIRTTSPLNNQLRLPVRGIVTAPEGKR